MNQAKIKYVVYLLAFAAFVHWIALLDAILSTVSRGDFIWEMWHIGPSIEEKDWGSVLGLIFKIFGGHFGVYTRLAQVFNYIVFDYSGVFTKYSNILPHVLMGFGLLFFAKKVENFSMKGALFYAWGVAYLVNPIAADNIAWIDSNISYYAVNVWLMFLLPIMTPLLAQSHWNLKTCLKIFAFCIVIIIGCGVGWAVIPFIFVVWFMTSEKMKIFRQSQGWKSYLIVSLITLGALYGAREFIIFFTHTFEKVFYLDDLNRAFVKIGDNLPFVFRFAMSTFVLPFARSSVDKTWLIGFTIFLSWVLAVFVLIAKNKIKDKSYFIYFLLTVFGFFVVGLIAVGRWEIAANRNTVAFVPTYYSILIMPFYLGLPFVWYGAIEHKLTAITKKTVAGAFLGMSLVFGVTTHSLYLREFKSTKEWYEAARFGTQNWNLIMQTRLSGAGGFAVEYLIAGVLPGLKKWGKDKALTEPFIDNPQQWAEEHQIKVPAFNDYKAPAISGICPDYKDIIAVEEDKRGLFSNPPRNPIIPFVRSSGYVASPNNCRERPEFVFLANKDGKILCVSRPGMKYWDIDEADQKRLHKHMHAIVDFSCPLFDSEPKDHAPFQLFALYKQHDLLLRVGEGQ